MDNGVLVDSDAIYQRLLGYVNVEKGQKTEFKLDRMEDLASRLGHPERSWKCVHVAGSKGKGSISTMIARILAADGHRTGLYTSPHILRWKERLTLAGEELPEEILLEAYARLRPLIEGRSAADFKGGEFPTYFELTTLLAFEAFRLRGCDRAVIETGLGGRLDSTNIVDPELSVITPLELEHTEFLGDNLGAIAFEKAGIIKPGKPVYVSKQAPEALEVLQEVALRRGSALHSIPALARIGPVSVTREGTEAELLFPAGWPWEGPRSFRVPLIGGIQAENMALAIVAAAAIEPGLKPETAAAGLATAFLPARFQILPGEPPLVIDGAHTPTSVALTLATFRDLFPGPAHLVFACASDKHHEEMARILGPHFAKVTITRPGSFKASDPEIVYASFKEHSASIELEAQTRSALLTARERAREAGLPLLVTGSFYLCAEAVSAFS